MTDLIPTLIRSHSGKIYHITNLTKDSEGGYLTRCGKSIKAFPESHALRVDDDERCEKCGTVENYRAVMEAQVQREAEERRAHTERVQKAQETNELRNQIRPHLVKFILDLMNAVGIVFTVKAHLNADDLYCVIDFHGQIFTIKMTIWNGARE